jgi:hypothetical protein
VPGVLAEGVMNPDVFNDQENNSFARAARLVKAEGLLRAIDRFSVDRGSPVLTAELMKWDDAHWRFAALVGGVNFPHEKTRSMVCLAIAERELAAVTANERRAAR